MIQVVVITLIASLAFSSETMKGARKDFAAVKQELNAKLSEAEVKLEELKANAKSNASETKAAAIKEAEAARDQIRKNIGELQEDGKTGWRKMKNGLAASIDKLNYKIQKALRD